MCGVFGWVARSETSPGLDVLKALTDLLHHRGPDGGDAVLISASDGEYRVGLGHRRLAIVDLTDAATQPMWSADRSCCITYNGEIYNYIELRAELEQLGCVFHTTGDTEILLAALQIWGKDALSRLRGMFAFAFFDSRDQSILFARDPFGKKPLFLCRKGEDLFFSSEVAALLAVPGLKTSFDLAALDGYLLDRYAPSPRTFFGEVEKLPAGSLAVWRAGRLTVERYFTPPLAHVTADIDNFDHAVAEFTEVFDEAVRIRMRSDAPYGLFLSGGVDSSSVLAFMASNATRPIKTFSVGFEDPSYSELSFARLAAKHFEAEHEEHVITPDQFFELWPEAARLRGAPVSEASDMPILLLARAASEKVKVVLTGEGADELFGGYPKYVAELYAQYYHAATGPWLHESIVAPVVEQLPFGLRRVKVLSKALGQRDAADRVRIWFGGLSPAERNALFDRKLRHARPDPFPFSARNVSNLRKAEFFDQTSWLPDNTLERADRMLMGGSIEGRMPFMDVELARLAARIPDRFHIRRLKGKAVLRAAVKGRVPEILFRRKKIGFRVPVNIWFRESHSHVVFDLLCSGDSRVRKVLNATLIDRYVAEHMDGRSNNERILWSLCSLEQFIRVYDIGADEIIEALAGAL
ncbi:asparagine synthase (glutamine-hydrolyzing) [Rhodoblastus sp. 17X3]|uniref:asparagine synthase (glutamine-hydrolyzing) n=1 Tax=Rhodoblastus sp. 17X3 TaxID=3047026 RepID=UPI0024B843A6|nr:asparagine synthase (glutamine-hydrolyzing) [Rhodoblastus sp. 17X3]MDI9848784.1 asparagine synthase (glutamine-hydrolyzing) [Rhodoblastus sp. 17X3]